MSDPDFPYLDEFQRVDFPEPGSATEEGIVACGGNLSPGMLLSAYSSGAFPWYNEDEPILWWNPDPRCVLIPERVHVSARMGRKLRSSGFRTAFDSAFREVISSCAGIKRMHEDGTWINQEIIESYCRLHELGWAHSVEIYKDDVLAGGLYGISLGRCFFGESMFSRVADASKAALISLAGSASGLGIELIDCQITTPHLLSMGAQEISRAEYMRKLGKLLEYPDNRNRWKSFLHSF